MLKVTLHAGCSTKATFLNCLGWLELRYDKLAPIATYQGLLVAHGTGAMEPVAIENYPRWSGSLWALVARALALSLNRKLELGEEPPPASRCAFATALSAVIEHWPSGPRPHRRRLGALEVVQAGRRGQYRAHLTEDILDTESSPTFTYTPVRLTHWALALRGCAWALTGRSALPAVPAFIAPETIQVDGKPMLPIGRLLEPARTGFLRWLATEGREPIVDVEGTTGLVPEGWYVEFLCNAI